MPDLYKTSGDDSAIDFDLICHPIAPWATRSLYYSQVRESVSDNQTGELMNGRVSWVCKTYFRVLISGREYEVANSKQTFKDMGPFVVGDEVSCVIADDMATVFALKNRTSTLSKLEKSRGQTAATAIAANIDIAVIVASVSKPVYHSRLVDRYLLVCEYGNITPLVCFNKIDEATSSIDRYTSDLAAMEIDSIKTSAKTGDGIDELKNRLTGKVSILLGSSGVGKTTLATNFSSRDEDRSFEVSTSSGKGRHSTTVSTLRRWNDDSFLIDTPGVRSLSVNVLEKAELRHYFAGIRDYQFACQFDNCLHDTEPNCSVKHDVNSGVFPSARYESYLRLLHDD